jgi:succinate dehydrogenase / fumarate reductase membrane anchor subunit
MTLLVAMIALTFLHLQLGLQNIIEDYVHREGAKIALALFNKGICFSLALLCVISVAKVGLTGTHGPTATIGLSHG